MPGKYILLLIMLVCFGHILAMGTEIGGYGTPVIYYLKEGYYPVDPCRTVEKTMRNWRIIFPLQRWGP